MILQIVELLICILVAYIFIRGLQAGLYHIADFLLRLIIVRDRRAEERQRQERLARLTRPE